VSGVTIETVPEALAGQRIDNYLLRQLKGVPRTRVYRLLRKGEVRVNGGRIRPTYRLVAGDTVRIPPVRQAHREPMEASDRILARLESAIVYEDSRVVILDKPSGLAVHGGSGIAYGVIEALRQLRPNAPFLDLAHRLDRDTSGCLAIAKRRSSLRTLHTAFREGAVDKRYLTLLRGHLSAPTVRMEAPLKAFTGQGGERVMRVAADGQFARTDFTVLASYQAWSLVEAQLHTGRMHQIRAHAAHLGHPVAMDARYGDAQADRELRAIGLKRLFLHAASLKFELPPEGRIAVEAPLPAALVDCQRRLSDAR